MKKSCIFILAVFMTLSAFSSPDKKQFKLRLRDQVAGYLDETLIYFDIGTSTSYTFPEDAEKNFDTAASIPLVYSFSSDHIPCYSNGYGLFTKTTVVPVGIKVQSGTYIFSANSISNFDSTSLLFLEDRQLGTFTNLRAETDTVQIDTASTIEGRFFIHVTYPPLISSMAAGCRDNDGVIIISQDTIVTWDSCNLYDGDMHLIFPWLHVNGSFNFTALPSGTYYLSFVYGRYTVVKKIVVDGHQIAASITASVTNALPGDTISFTSEAVNATDYQWNFGDGTIIYGIANPKYIYTNLGVFTVTLKASNSFGCVAYDDVAITVAIPQTTSIDAVGSDNVRVISDNKNLRIHLDNVTGSNYSYEVYNVIGQMLTTGPLTSSETTVYLNNQPPGVYVVNVKGGRKSFSKKVYLSE